jgi:hypothetical protein
MALAEAELEDTWAVFARVIASVRPPAQLQAMAACRGHPVDWFFPSTDRAGGALLAPTNRLDTRPSRCY